MGVDLQFTASTPELVVMRRFFIGIDFSPALVSGGNDSEDEFELDEELEEVLSLFIDAAVVLITALRSNVLLLIAQCTTLGFLFPLDCLFFLMLACLVASFFTNWC